jgi:RND family efflux transporter MFP subunit
LIGGVFASRLAPILLSILLASLPGACGRRQEASAPAPVRPVLTAPVEMRTSKLFGPFTGVIAPRYATDLGFQIGGRIVARDVSIGDSVAKGRRLAALDATLPQYQLASAQAELASAEAQFANAQATEGRQKSLLQTGSATQAQIDTAVANLASAQAKLNQAKSGLQAAQNQLSYAILRADYDGVITAVTAEVGQVVSAGQTIVTLARPDVREALFDVPDSMVDQARPDGEFAISLLADPSVTATGKVREIAPLSDPATRTRRIRLSLDKPPNAFRLGSTVSIALSEPTAPQVVVPATALFDDGDASAVWIADPAAGIVRKVAVKLIERRGDRAIVEAKLSGGELVVTAGAHSLSDGESVKVEPAP